MLLRAWKRARLRRKPLPDAWWRIIERYVPYVRRLRVEERRALAGIIRVLMAEKHFEGCGGLEMTDEIRVTIAAQAALLVLHREGEYYPQLRTILVYPNAFVAPMKHVGPGGLVTEAHQPRLGESWTSGAIVLSWDDVVRGAADVHDGHNLVFHEFAHQLDSEDGGMNGAPFLGSAGRYREWARVLSAEYADLQRSVARGDQVLIDRYGATNPAEFFAVVTELFFEQPVALRSRYPELYAEFRAFYQQDPAARAG